MRLKNDGIESMGVFVANGSRAATIKVGRAGVPLSHTGCPVITPARGSVGRGIIKLETDRRDHTGTQLLGQRNK